MVIYKFIAERLQKYHYRWKNKRYLRRWKKDAEERLQQLKRRELHERIEKQKRELHEMEKRKYPLFYWRELAKEKEHPKISTTGINIMWW